MPDRPHDVTPSPTAPRPPSPRPMPDVQPHVAPTPAPDVVPTPGGQTGDVPVTGADISPTPDDLTADSLRHALDRGQGGDKVDFADPAAAPLGTDDEAAGFPPTREQIRMAAAQELGPRPAERLRARRTIPTRLGNGRGLGLVLVLVVLIVVLVAVFVAQ